MSVHRWSEDMILVDLPRELEKQNELQAVIGLPRWGYRGTWGYAPSGVLGLLWLVVLVLLFTRYIPQSI